MSNENSETTPLTSQKAWAPSRLMTAVLCVTMIALSVGIINFNKWLMDGRFPYAVPLVLLHMVFCTTAAAALIMAKPSLFPAIKDPIAKINLDAELYMKGFFPIAILFAVALVLGNVAYAHLGIAFIQMIKESNIVWVYILAVVSGMERFALRNTQVVCLAIVAMTLTIQGELNFEVVGFVIQLAAVLSEAVRIVLQGFILQGKKVDPLSYVLLMSPCCASLLFATLLFIMALPDRLIGPDLALPSWAAIWKWWPWLLADCMVAFCLNVSIAMVLKHTGPMSYLMCGLMKDVCAVCIGVFVLHEACSLQQGLGFVLQIFCVTTWSLMKANPDNFESGIFTGLYASAANVFRAPKAPLSDKEKAPETEVAPAKV